HAVARLTYPFRLPGGQFVEASVQAYSGRFVLPTVATGVGVDAEYADERQAVTLVWYAQPFGVVAEYNVGKGPQYNAVTNAVESHDLSGGFVQVMYRWRSHGRVIQPFARMHEYHGGKKAEQDGRHYSVHEVEAGVEWLVNSSLELTAQFTDSDRLFEDSRTVGNRQVGRFLRLQAQINY
ncbi:MAG: porin, partial [Candidatus Eisenbacteria bacterium]